jgi:hypothetical protein
VNHHEQGFFEIVSQELENPDFDPTEVEEVRKKEVRLQQSLRSNNGLALVISILLFTSD